MKLLTEKAIKQKFGNPKAIKKLTQPLKTIPCFHIVENEIDKEIIQMNKWKDGVDAVLLGYCYKCETVYYYEMPMGSCEGGAVMSRKKPKIRKCLNCGTVFRLSKHEAWNTLHCRNCVDLYGSQELYRRRKVRLYGGTYLEKQKEYIRDYMRDYRKGIKRRQKAVL